MLGVLFIYDSIMANLGEIAEFNMTDGLTPLQVRKLNANFKSLLGSIRIIDPKLVTNYNDLENKPKIEGVILEYDKTFGALGLASLTNQEIERICT